MKSPIKLISIPFVIALAVIFLWFGTLHQAFASPGLRYVATTGSDGGNDCSNSSNPCATVQHAIDMAVAGEEVRIAGGTYAPGSTVATITKEVRLIGGFDSSYSALDPDLYPTTLDAGGNGSVIYVSNAGDVFLQHLIVTHGDGLGNCFPTLAGCGGGIYSKDSDIHVFNSTVVENVGSSGGSGFGGGIYIDADFHVAEIEGSQILSNTAALSSTLPSQYGYGGGIYIYQGTASIIGNEVRDNIGSVNHGGSGGIHMFEVVSASISDNIITGNWSNTNNYWSDGGGIDIQFSSGIVVSGNLIENNHAAMIAGYGGGVHVWESDVHLTSNMIISNTTGTFLGYGGGVSINSTIPVTLSNNLIARNFAGITGGGVVAVKNGAPLSQVILVNNTIVDNGLTGVVGSGYADLTLTNNLIAGQNEGLNVNDPFTVTITADTNLFWNTSDPVVGTNAILAAPLLTADYHLLEGSPALDAGIIIPWLTTDLEGNPRPQGSGYDLGAYEGAWHALFLPVLQKNYSSQPTLLFSDDFEDGNLSNWTSHNGTWTNPGNYMHGDYTLGNAWNIRSSSGADVIYEGTVTLLSGTAAGLVFRSNGDGSSSYDVIIDKVDGLFKLSKRSPYHVLDSYAMTVQTNHPYQIKVVANGSTIEAYLDGVKRLSVTDATLSSGNFGVILFQAQASYDDLKAWALP